MSGDPRGSREERGYGYEHQRVRAALVEAATPDTLCVRCGEPLGNPTFAHLGHSDDRSTWSGLEHARCNIAAANRMRASRGRRREEPHPGLITPGNAASSTHPVRTKTTVDCSHDGDCYTSGEIPVSPSRVAPRGEGASPASDPGGGLTSSYASLPAASVRAEGNDLSVLRTPLAPDPDGQPRADLRYTASQSVRVSESDQ